MEAHVDPETLSLMEVGHHVHTREAHCQASGCSFASAEPAKQAEALQAAKDWKSRYGGTNVATRAGDIRARRIINSHLNKQQFGA